MASSLVKVAGFVRNTKCFLSPHVRKFNAAKTIQTSRFISTSKKNKDSASSVEPIQPAKGGTESPEEMFPADPKHDKNWISYGYDLIDKEMDRYANGMTMFMGVTVCLVWVSFIFAYMPDHQLADWSQREAYLELARREREGLPLIDCELIDPSKIVLPTEEELGDAEIII